MLDWKNLSELKKYLSTMWPHQQWPDVNASIEVIKDALPSAVNEADMWNFLNEWGDSTKGHFPPSPADLIAGTKHKLRVRLRQEAGERPRPGDCAHKKNLYYNISEDGARATCIECGLRRHGEPKQFRTMGDLQADDHPLYHSWNKLVHANYERDKIK